MQSQSAKQEAIDAIKRLTDSALLDEIGFRLCVLNIPIAQLQGDAPVTRKTRAALSPRLERRLKQIEHLSPKPKQQLLSIIDTFIAAEGHRAPQNRSGSRS